MRNKFLLLFYFLFYFIMEKYFSSNSFDDEIVRVLSTYSENNCLRYKPFFEKHGYQVDCSSEKATNGTIYKLTATKKNNAENKRKDEKIVSTILAKDPSVDIQSYRRTTDSSKYVKKQTSTEKPFSFEDPDFTVLNTFDSSEKCSEYIKHLESLGWNSVRCHRESKNGVVRYYVYAIKSQTKLNANILDKGRSQQIELNYSKDNESDNKEEGPDIYGDEGPDIYGDEGPDVYGDEVDNDDLECDEDEMMKKMFNMEDNTLKMGHYIKEEGLSKEESIKLINITKNLYNNITRIWKISDKLGRNIKILGSKYKKLCLESKMQRSEYERVCLKLKAMRREKRYLEDVKKRYMDYRCRYEKRSREYERTMEDYEQDYEYSFPERDIESSRMTDEFDCEEEREKIRQLEREVAYLKKYRNMDETERDKLKARYERKLEDIKVNISKYKERIDNLTKSSEETRRKIEDSTTLVDSIMEKRNCNTIYGGGENTKKVNDRKMIYFSVYKYLDPKYIESMKTNVTQWAKLSNYIWGMNKIMSIEDPNTLLNYNLVAPNIPDEHKKYYLLFLYQLSILKVISDSECKTLAKALKLPKGIDNCRAMKKYFKEDIDNLTKFLESN